MFRWLMSVAAAAVLAAPALVSADVAAVPKDGIMPIIVDNKHPLVAEHKVDGKKYQMFIQKCEGKDVCNRPYYEDKEGKTHFVDQEDVAKMVSLKYIVAEIDEVTDKPKSFKLVELKKSEEQKDKKTFELATLMSDYTKQKGANHKLVCWWWGRRYYGGCGYYGGGCYGYYRYNPYYYGGCGGYYNPYLYAGAYGGYGYGGGYAYGGVAFAGGYYGGAGGGYGAFAVGVAGYGGGYYW